MQIYVCVKHVPDTAANIRPLGGPQFDEAVKFIMNPYDENALEQALKVREGREGTEVVAVSVGKAAAEATLRYALAMGADRAILVKTEGYFIDPQETALLIREAILSDGSPGLIFTGKQSVDVEGMQTPFRLAALLFMPVAVDAVAFSLSGDLVTVERELEGDLREIVEMSLPCIVGAAKGLNRPRCPTLPDMMKSKKKEIRVVNRADLAVEAPAPGVEFVDLEPVPDRGKGAILQDSPEGMARRLLDLLRDEAKVL
jgi:electron transfer flavoprotein beta subunit